jgi:hypothetical protein
VSTFHEGDMVGLIRHDKVSDTCSYAKVLVDARTWPSMRSKHGWLAPWCDLSSPARN